MPRPRAAALLALVIALAPALAAPDARAGGLADEAELHFQLATEAYQKGDFSHALEHFFQSNRLVPNKNVVFNIARTYEQLHRFADAHRYYTDALEEEDRPAQVQAIQAALRRVAPSVAILKVQTTPPGATVYIDRKDLGSRGRAPRALAVPEGSYRVIVELDGYEPATIGPVAAKIGAETAIPVTLTRVVGTLAVTVQGAPGAAVHIDDESAPPVCNAPCSALVSPGRHLVYFSREGFQAPPRQITIVAKQTTRTVATLAPLTGSIAISADEGSAVVEIDGKLWGSTPANASTPTVIQSVGSGTRHVRVTLRGYEPVDRVVEIKTGQQAELLDLKLVPLRTVSAVSRYAEQIEDAPSSVSIIDGQELRAFGYPTIAEALRGTRGVYISNDRSYYSIGIRGLGQPNDYGNRLLVLSDGATLNDNILSSSYVGSDGRVDLHDVDRIEVVRGPGSLLYGTGAFSGVVNLVPKGKDDPSNVHVEVGTYDNAVAHGRAGFQYNWKRDVGIWASVAGARSDGFDAPITLLNPPTGQSAKQTVGSVEAFRSVGTAGRFWAKDLTAQWFYMRRTEEIPVGAFSTVVGDTRTRYTDDRFLAEIRYEPKLSDKVQLLLRAHANRYGFEGAYAYAEDDTHPAAVPSTIAVEEYTGVWFGAEGRVIVTPRKEIRVTAGGEAQASPTADLKGSYPDDPGTKPYLSTHSPYGFGAGYAVVDADPVKWLRLSGGARVDGYEDFGAVFVPRGAVIVKPTQGGTLKAMVGRAFRVPSIYERFYTDGSSTQLPGDDKTHKLEPESILSGELEYSQRFASDWVALAAGHLSKVDNYIETLPDTVQPKLFRYVNTPNPVLAAGADVELRREWRQGWMLGLMYGYQRTQRSNFGDSALPAIKGDPRLVNAPEHLASLKGVVPVVTEVASLAVRATFEAPRIDAYGNETTPQIIADVAVSGRLRRYGVSYVFGCYNFIGTRVDYPVSLSYSSPTATQNGRTFLADIKVEYP